MNLLLTASSVSPKYPFFRVPDYCIIHLPLSIGPETSPVYAPLSSQYISCAPTAMPLSLRALQRRCIHMTHTATRTSSGKLALQSIYKSHGLRRCLYIFQLPAISFFLGFLSAITAMPGRTFPSRNSREAPPPVDMGYSVCESKLLYRRR